MPAEQNALYGRKPTFAGSSFTSGVPGTEVVLTDGFVPTAGSGYGGSVFGIGGTGSTLEWTLAGPTTLKSLRVFTRWDGGRDGISVAKVWVKTSAEGDYADIGAPVASIGAGNDTSGALSAILSDGASAATMSTSAATSFGIWGCSC